MESTYGRMAEGCSEIAKDLCKNESFENFASGVASSIAGTAVGIVTVNPALGIAAGTAVAGFSRSHKKEVAEAVTFVGTAAAVSIASIAAVPALACYGVYKLFESIFED